MGRVVRAGFAGAIRRWPVIILLWAVGGLFGLAFSLATGQWLDLALDGSYASRTLLKDLNAHVLIDLWVYHKESLAMLAWVGMALGVTHLAFSIWLNAGVVRTVQDPDASVTLGAFWQHGFALYGVFARLWLLIVLTELAVVAGAVGAVWGCLRWLAESPSEMPLYYIVGAASLFCGMALVVLVTIHDHARIYASRTGAGALRAVRWATWFIARGDWRALPLALVLLLGGVAAWGVYQTVAMWLPVTSAVGVLISLLWGQVLMQCRALLRVATFAAQAELQSELLE